MDGCKSRKSVTEQDSRTWTEDNKHILYRTFAHWHVDRHYWLGSQQLSFVWMFQLHNHDILSRTRPTWVTNNNHNAVVLLLTTSPWCCHHIHNARSKMMNNDLRSDIDLNVIWKLLLKTEFQIFITISVFNFLTSNFHYDLFF